MASARAGAARAAGGALPHHRAAAAAHDHRCGGARLRPPRHAAHVRGPPGADRQAPARTRSSARSGSPSRIRRSPAGSTRRARCAPTSTATSAASSSCSARRRSAPSAPATSALACHDRGLIGYAALEAGALEEAERTMKEAWRAPSAWGSATSPRSRSRTSASRWRGSASSTRRAPSRPRRSTPSPRSAIGAWSRRRSITSGTSCSSPASRCAPRRRRATRSSLANVAPALPTIRAEGLAVLAQVLLAQGRAERGARGGGRGARDAGAARRHRRRRVPDPRRARAGARGASASTRGAVEVLRVANERLHGVRQQDRRRRRCARASFSACRRTRASWSWREPGSDGVDEGVGLVDEQLHARRRAVDAVARPAASPARAARARRSACRAASRAGCRAACVVPGAGEMRRTDAMSATGIAPAKLAGQRDRQRVLVERVRRRRACCRRWRRIQTTVATLAPRMSACHHQAARCDRTCRIGVSSVATTAIPSSEGAEHARPRSREPHRQVRCRPLDGIPSLRLASSDGWMS